MELSSKLLLTLFGIAAFWIAITGIPAMITASNGTQTNPEIRQSDIPVTVPASGGAVFASTDTVLVVVGLTFFGFVMVFAILMYYRDKQRSSRTANIAPS